MFLPFLDVLQFEGVDLDFPPGREVEIRGSDFVEFSAAEVGSDRGEERGRVFQRAIRKLANATRQGRIGESRAPTGVTEETRSQAGIVPLKEVLRRSWISEPLGRGEAAAEEKRVRARPPAVVPASEKQPGLLILLKGDEGLTRLVVVGIVDIPVFLLRPLAEEVERVVRRGLPLDLAVDLVELCRVVEAHVHSRSVAPAVIQAEADLAARAEDGGDGADFVSVAPLGGDAPADPVGFEELRILLVRDILRERPPADRGEKVRQKQLIEPGRLGAKRDAFGIALRVERIGKEEMGRGVGIIALDST